jgi:uncharacterized protein YbdZ (MbtH family)
VKKVGYAWSGWLSLQGEGLQFDKTVDHKNHTHSRNLPKMLWAPSKAHPAGWRIVGNKVGQSLLISKYTYFYVETHGQRL